MYTPMQIPLMLANSTVRPAHKPGSAASLAHRDPPRAKSPADEAEDGAGEDAAQHTARADVVQLRVDEARARGVERGVGVALDGAQRGGAGVRGGVRTVESCEKGGGEVELVRGAGGEERLLRARKEHREVRGRRGCVRIGVAWRGGGRLRAPVEGGLRLPLGVALLVLAQPDSRG